MSVYVVTWNLNKEGSAYSTARANFLKHLGKYDNIADPGLETVRWISTNESPYSISEYLRQKLDDDDKLFVSRLPRDGYAGWLLKSVWEWIQARE